MLHPDVEKLIYLVDKWAKTIKQYHGDNHWVAHLEKSSSYLRNSDFYGVEHLLEAFGGMGSITDFSLVPERGGLVIRQKNRYTNWKYSKLVNRVYKLAFILNREQKSK